MASIDQVIAVVDHSAEFERKFAERRNTQPSVYAYHGTGYDCLYSLARNGLRNLSNSQFMTTGAVFGSGIYIAPDYEVAAGYAKSVIHYGPYNSSYQSNQAYTSNSCDNQLNAGAASTRNEGSYETLEELTKRERFSQSISAAK